MPTTKKVASISKKNVQAQGSRMSKTAKKIPGALTKKTAKSSVSKLVINDATSKGRQKKGAMHSKLDALAALHAAKKESTDRRAAIVKERALNLRPTFALALLSPYRFPVDIEKLAVGSARFGGVFFVFLGAIFTLFFANGAFNAPTLTASVIESTTGTLAMEVDLHCDRLQSETGDVCPDVDKTPDATFNIQYALSGATVITVKVPDALRVTLGAYYKSGQQELKFGPMASTSLDTWELSVNTKELADGEYKLKALISNRYGSYEAVHTEYVVVENHPIVDVLTDIVGDTEEVDELSEVSLNDEESIKEEAAADDVITSDSTHSSEEFRFEVEAVNADAVKIHAFQTTTKKSIFLGNAYRSASDLWKYRWDASNFEQGEYLIKAQVIRDLGSSPTEQISVQKTERIEAEPDPLQDSDLLQKTSEALLREDVSIDIQANSPLSGVAGVKIDVPFAALVEVYVQSRYELMKKFVGMAALVDTDTWIYRLNTKELPNGEYTLIVVIKNSYGSYESKSEFFKIRNEAALTYTPKQTELVKTISLISSEVRGADVLPEEDPAEIVGAETMRPQEESADQIIDTFKERIQKELDRLTSALRVDDEEAVVLIKERLEALKQEILASSLEEGSEQVLAQRIDTYLEEALSRVKAAVKTTEKLIVSRTQEQANFDSDSDGIADYDEVALFNTDPFRADSDNDGFIDSAEILNGYDPTDPVSEVLVTFESPKESGVVREDILEVTSIIAALPNDEADTKKQEAIISGKALPNSFVTLYIFSTPIVITLKTEADGSWNYRFDKELDDGEHEIFVGMTDNAGKIIAKSNPFTFVKEAEAYTQGSKEEKAAAPAIVKNDSLLSSYMIYLILSISVVAIGLVLILLGLHLDTRRKTAIVTEGKEVPV